MPAASRIACRRACRTSRAAASMPCSRMASGSSVPSATCSGTPSRAQSSRTNLSSPSRYLLSFPHMAEETESGATLLAKKEYARAVPLLKREHEKYPSNPRIRLQYADALAGAGQLDDAAAQYEATAKYYDDNGLTVQAIAVRKKAEKVQEQLAAKKPAPPAQVAGKREPLFDRSVPKSPLIEELT